MMPSELVQKLAKDMTSWLNSLSMEGVVMQERTLETFIVRWLLDNNVTVSCVPITMPCLQTC